MKQQKTEQGIKKRLEGPFTTFHEGRQLTLCPLMQTLTFTDPFTKKSEVLRAGKDVPQAVFDKLYGAILDQQERIKTGTLNKKKRRKKK